MSRVKEFIQTLTESEKIELIQEVKKMIDSGQIEINGKKPSIEFSFMDDY